MVKLKTLKDLELGWVQTNPYGIHVDVDKIREVLKQEAIKWIKEGKSIWIDAEKFFNIVEEDLK